MTFKERRRYRDDKGRMWVIKQIVTLTNGTTMMLVREVSPMRRMQLATDDGDGFGTIYTPMGTSMLVDEEWE